MKTADFLEDYIAALAWIEGQGITIRPDSRFVFYREIITGFVNVAKKSMRISDEERGEILRNFPNAASEAAEMVYIYKAFRDGQVRMSRRKLVQVLQGPPEYPQEESDSSSNHARNTMFELFTIAMLKNAGFSCDSRTEADLLFQSEEFPIYIECKRPMKLSTITKNVLRANQQLKARLKGILGLPRGKGLIALSLTKIINPEQNILRFSNEDKMHLELKRLIREAHFKIQEQTNLREAVDKKVVGWMGVVSLPVFVESTNSDVSIYTQSLFVNITNRSEPEHEAINRLGKVVQDSFSFES